jgi:hypothetical protein
MSDDRFYNEVRSTMANFQPEVPASAYSGMRKKLWWSNFTKLSATRFNVWYLAILATGAAVALNLSSETPLNEAIVVEQSTQTTEIAQPVLEATNASPEVMPSNESQGSAKNSQSEHNSKGHAKQLSNESAVTGQVVVEETTVGANNAQQVTSTMEVNPEKESQLPASGGAKRGLKVKTYTDGQQKK